MKKELNKKSDVVTVVVDVSFKDNIETVRHFIERTMSLFIAKR